MELSLFVRAEIDVCPGHSEIELDRIEWLRTHERVAVVDADRLTVCQSMSTLASACPRSELRWTTTQKM